MKTLDAINMGVMLLVAITAVRRYRQVDTATRIFCLLVIADFVTEAIALYAGRQYHNNMPVYSIYSLLEFLLVCAYFNKVIDVLRLRNRGLLIGIAGLLIGALNLLCLQPLNTLNSYFLFFEGIVIMVLALLAVLRWMLMAPQPVLHAMPAFWFSILLAFFWSVTFLSWGFYDYFSLRLGSNWIIDIVILLINITFYLGIGTVLLLYPKMLCNE